MEQERKLYQKKRFVIPAIVSTPFIMSALVTGTPNSVPVENTVVTPSKTIEVKKIKEKELINNSVIVEEEIKPKPIQNKPTETKQCHPSYSGCLNPSASDYDCAGGSGNGPYYTGPVQVYGSDPFDLDRDNDGWGCE
jgi:hypothetical protein